MKKAYITPSTEVTQLAFSSILCLSGELDGSKTLNGSDEFGTRENNAWDIWGEVEDDVEE